MKCHVCGEEIEVGQHYVPIGEHFSEHVGCCAKDDGSSVLHVRQFYDTFVRGSENDRKYTRGEY